MFTEMHAFVQDSFEQRIAADTAFANLHLGRDIAFLREKWSECPYTTTKANLHRISALQAGVSTDYFDVTELQNKISNDLANVGTRAFAKEYNYIWSLQNPPSLDDVISFTTQSLKERMRVLNYYLTLNAGDWLWILFIGLIYFLWVFINFRKIKLAADKKK